MDDAEVTIIVRDLDECLQVHPNDWTPLEYRAHRAAQTVSLPTEHGFPDNGEHFEELSADEDFNQVFCDYDVIEAAPTATHLIPEKLWGVNSFINDLALAHYLRGGEPVPGEFEVEAEPIIIKVMYGTPFIFQGTHRLLALRMQGQTHFTGKLVYVD